MSHTHHFGIATRQCNGTNLADFLGPEIADELIADAYRSAEAGEHLPDPGPPKYCADQKTNGRRITPAKRAAK